MAVLPKVRTGCRGSTPSWGLRPHTSDVLSSMRNAITFADARARMETSLLDCPVDC